MCGGGGGGNLTGRPSRGNGSTYYYYHCRKGCKNRIRSEKAHTMLKNDILKEISVSDNVLALYKEILIDIQQKKRGNKLKDKIVIEKKIEDTIKALETVEGKLIK